MMLPSMSTILGNYIDVIQIEVLTNIRFRTALLIYEY
jgi:hypothetical protein